MINFDEKNTNELLINMKQLELEHNVIKEKIIFHHDEANNFYKKLEQIESLFKDYSNEILKRSGRK